MNIYKLTPINLDSRDWQASTHRSGVTIQAPNEDRARFIAQSEFGIAVALQPGQPVAIMPWPYKHRATCELIGSNDDTTEGILEVDHV